ncbi:hypothetical protein ACI2K4_24990 [Micromonospora sp. NPDC050397]|uniref:hypothetical protein n=1 Tax=Micromonospora sp. NPDC050397 TaxID=3364279 RepID=UPI00384AEAE3
MGQTDFAEGQTDEPRARSLRDHRAAAAVAAASDSTPEQVLAALALLDGVRADLDRIERTLIESARDGRTSWARIATALGLTSRQAAEQRWLRLRGDSGRDPGRVRETRQRQQSVDITYGTAIRRLRAAAEAANRHLDADPEWDTRHPRAELARTSIEAASTAAPGALYALVVQALADLDAMASPPDRRPPDRRPPGGTPPGGTTPSGTTPDGALPSGTMRGEAMPGGAMRGEAMRGEAMRGGMLPDAVPRPLRAALHRLRRAADTARPEPDPDPDPDSDSGGGSTTA